MDEVFEFELPMMGVDSSATVYGLFDNLAKRVRDKLDSMSILPPKDVVMEAAGRAYDAYIAPFDIPFVPNFMEPVVDAQLRSVFLGVVDNLYDAISAKKRTA